MAGHRLPGVGCLTIQLFLAAIGPVLGGVIFLAVLGANNRGSVYVQNNNILSATNNNTGSAIGTTVAQLSDEPPAIQTQTAIDLRELNGALDSRISQWNSQLTADEYHTISGADAGLTADNNIKEVDYGKCGTALYVYVVENTRPDTGPADGEGYAYTTASSAAVCHPPSWGVYDSEDVGGGWYFVTLKS